MPHPSGRESNQGVRGVSGQKGQLFGIMAVWTPDYDCDNRTEGGD